MKKLLLGTLALTMLATACKKDDDSSSSNANTVSVGGTSYSTTSTGGSVTVTGNTVTAAGVNGNSLAAGLTFEFPGSSAPAAGTYKVVADTTGTLAANTVSFYATVASTTGGTFYASTGTGTVNATVTVNSGKLNITMPDAPAKQVNGTNTITVNANITQP